MNQAQPRIQNPELGPLRPLRARAILRPVEGGEGERFRILICNRVQSHGACMTRFGRE